VRAMMLIEAQAPEARAAIEQAIVQGAERYRVDTGGVMLRWPALLTMSRRA